MKYLVACNWDLDLLDQIDRPEVVAVFAGLPNTLISSGRPSSQIRPVPESHVRNYIKLVHDKKWSFDFNLNSPCLANKEVTQGGFKEIMKYLEWASDLGVDAVTITHTNLIGIVKKNFPKLRVNLSTFQKVSEVLPARRFEDMGVDMIMLSEHINRDFKTLAAIRKAVKCELALIPNTGCIFACPNMHSHANSVAHSGAKGGGDFMVDPFTLSCFCKRMESPEELVKIRWIRPEDVSLYEEVGIDTLKIIERYSTTAVLAERVKAYCERSFEGNLIRLLGQMVDLKTSTGRAKEMTIKRMLTRPGPTSLRAGKAARKFCGVFESSLYDLFYLDNKKIPTGFAKSFASRDCKTSDCRVCGYCRGVASKAVAVVDEPRLAATRERANQALDEIREGTMLY